MDAPAAKPFSAEDFRARAQRQDAVRSGPALGDHSLNPHLTETILREGLRAASVLIGVVDHPSGGAVILTKRNEHLRSHSGQVAFPGGGVDPTDLSPEDAALRETEEEIGLDRSFISLVGRLPDYVTGSGYRVAPVLGVVRPGFILTANQDEVDDVFEVPLSFLMDPANHRRESRLWQDRRRFYYEMPFGERRIWGVTAGIIRSVYERLYA